MPERFLLLDVTIMSVGIFPPRSAAFSASVY
jgi:hypothetical protein